MGLFIDAGYVILANFAQYKNSIDEDLFFF